MLKKLIYAVPVIMGVSSFSAYATTNDITFTSEPAVLDMPCSAYEFNGDIGPNQTQVLQYTVKNNTSSNIKIASDLKVLSDDDSIATSRITSGTCGAVDGETFTLSANNTCTINVTIVSDVCEYLDDIEENIEIDRELVLTPQTMGNPISSEIALTVGNGYQQLAFIANAYGSNGDVTVCLIHPIYSDFDECWSSTQSGSFDLPIDVILNNDNSRAYVANLGNNLISVCEVETDTGTFGDCNTPPTPPENGFDLSSAGLRLNADNSKLYVTNYNYETVSICTIVEETGLPVYPCESYSLDLDDYYDDSPSGRLAFNPAGNPAYIANYHNSDIAICDFNHTEDCYPFFDSNSSIYYPLGLDTDLGNKWLYTSTNEFYYDPLNLFYYEYAIANCTINPITGDLETCDSSIGNPAFAYWYNNASPQTGDEDSCLYPDDALGCPAYFGFDNSVAVNLFMHNTNGFAYIPTSDVAGMPQGNIAICEIDLATGLLYSESCYFDLNYLRGSDGTFPTSVWISTLVDFYY